MQGEFQSCHFANKGWIVYILTVLCGSVYPAGSTSSAHWMRSPLFIHSFPRGQVLSLWWMGDGTGQLFSLDGTSLTRSELKRPPCLRSSAALLKAHVSLPIVLARTQTPASPPGIPGPFLIRIRLRSWGCSLQFPLHGSERFMPGGGYEASVPGERRGRNHGGCMEVVWPLRVSKLAGSGWFVSVKHVWSKLETFFILSGFFLSKVFN